MEIAQVGVNEGITGDPLFTFRVYILEKLILPKRKIVREIEIFSSSNEGAQMLSTQIKYLLVKQRRRQWHPTPVLCLENPMDRGAW